MTETVEVCKQCNSIWDPYNDSGSFLCCACECETKSHIVNTSTWIRKQFKSKIEHFYFILPEDKDIDTEDLIVAKSIKILDTILDDVGLKENNEK